MDGLLNGPTGHRPRGARGFTCKMSLKKTQTDCKDPQNLRKEMQNVDKQVQLDLE